MFKFFGKNNDRSAITHDLSESNMPKDPDSSSSLRMMPPPSDSGPLQTLSPERVNAGRPMSTTTTTTSYKSTVTSNSDPFDPQASPTRRAKANLFADYSPQKNTPSEKVTGFALPQSPSLPEINSLRGHARTNSDVQGLVKRFEHLDVRDRDAESVERKKRHEAELRRAQIAREEAESDVKRLREEMRRLRKDGDEGRERERRLARRVEVVQEELSTAKSAHESQSSVYEKELRRARKEGFKSSSAVLKLQEELKSTRNSLRITQQGFDLEKQKLQRKEQERFEMEYQLIPLQEQLEKLKQQLKTTEEEREALKTNLREEEVARIAAEGMIALPATESMDLDLASSPRKPPSPQKARGMFEVLEEDKENRGAVSKKAYETRRLAEDLERERMKREHAEEMVDFLRMECMFRCCGCRSHQLSIQLDAELASAVERVRAGMQHILTPQTSFDEGYGTQGETQETAQGGTHQDTQDATQEETPVTMSAISQEDQQPPVEPQSEHAAATNEVEMMGNEGQDRVPAVPSPGQSRSPGDQLLEEQQESLSTSPPEQQQSDPPVQEATISTVPLKPSTPPQVQRTPSRNQPSIRTVTTTTTVPMQFTPVSKPTKPTVVDTDSAIEDAENIPPTPNTTAGLPFDREAALKMIEYRRGRAKSIANGQATPRKQMMEGVNGRRDISAPTLGQKTAGGSGVKVVGGSAPSGNMRGKK